jgi:HD-like signal output (HDOD) protein
MNEPGSPPTYRSGTRSVAAGDAASTPQERAAALAFLQTLASEVSEGSIDLPCFPDVVIRISTALADPKTTTDHIVTIVGAEPRLAARILQTANSAAFNTSGKPLNDLPSAITRLGHQIVHGTAMSYAMHQMRNEPSLRSVAQPLSELWEKSIAVASISRIVARRTRISPDEAFLTGLLHGIGSLYIMARATTQAVGLGQHFWLDLVEGWQASIGKAVLESWGFGEAMCDAVGEQTDHDRRWKHVAGLADVLITSLALAEALTMPEPRLVVETPRNNAFLTVGVAPEECAAILAEADTQIRLVHEALAA